MHWFKYFSLNHDEKNAISHSNKFLMYCWNKFVSDMILQLPLKMYYTACLFELELNDIMVIQIIQIWLWFISLSFSIVSVERFFCPGSHITKINIKMLKCYHIGLGENITFFRGGKLQNFINITIYHTISQLKVEKCLKLIAFLIMVLLSL